MRVVCPFQNPFLANVYVIGEEGQPAILVDPGNNENDCLNRYLERHHKGAVAAILLTHGHYDHIYGLLTLDTNAPIYIHRDDVPYLTDDRLNLLRGLCVEGYKIKTVEDGEELEILGHQIQVIHTPYHTPGSVCYFFKEEKVLFSGDSLFHLSVGRSDLPGGNARLMESSLAKLRPLPPDTKVYPGHESITTLDLERRYNPYLQ